VVCGTNFVSGKGIKFGLLEELWYNVIDRVLPARSKEMTRQQGVVYLKRCILSPAFQQLAWFFALYDGFKIITDIKNVNTKTVTMI
jgi:hypothetical protein